MTRYSSSFQKDATSDAAALIAERQVSPKSGDKKSPQVKSIYLLTKERMKHSAPNPS